MVARVPLPCCCLPSSPLLQLLRTCISPCAPCQRHLRQFLRPPLSGPATGRVAVRVPRHGQRVNGGGGVRPGLLRERQCRDPRAPGGGLHDDGTSIMRDLAFLSHVYRFSFDKIPPFIQGSPPKSRACTYSKPRKMQQLSYLDPRILHLGAVSSPGDTVVKRRERRK